MKPFALAALCTGKTEPAAQFLGRLKNPLESFVAQVSDPLEIVPSGDTAYVYVGKPPTAFGLVWIQMKTLSLSEVKMKLSGLVVVN